MLHFDLKGGLKLPAVGFGTYKVQLEALLPAIETGYRYFDTASFYGTESYVGDAIRQSGIPREEFIIASKLWKTDMLGDVKAAFFRSLESIGTDYLDVYFIHWPRPDMYYADWKKLDRDIWHVLEELYSDGRIKALGLSNFLPYHAENIIASCEVMPEIAQLEFHPGHLQAFALNYYREKNILLQAWSPTGRLRVLDDMLIQSLARKYNVSTVQICLRFCLHEGVMPLPKASSREHMKANLECVNFELEPEDIAMIENMPPLGWGGEHPDRQRAKIV